jgi:hypothetical protein
MSTGLGGTGLVADDLYLLAHHDVTGRPLLQPRPLSIGLAGGLLAELMLGGSISVRHDGAVTAHRTWPADNLAHHVRDQIAVESEPHPVEEWLLFLARTTAGDVARRLERAGYLRHAVSRVPFRPGRWVPVDPDCAFTPVVRVRAALNAARPLVSQETALAGLSVACGLGFRLDQYQIPAGREISDAVGRLGPGLCGLIAQTQAAVDSALLSHRT